MFQQENNTFTNSIAWTISSLALVAYLSVAFMGLEYIVRGNHLVALGITLGGAIILGLGVWGMCRCKVSRNRRRAVPLGVLAFLCVGAILVAGSWPVTLYLYTYDHEKELSVLIADTRSYARRIEMLYNHYAVTRVGKYKLYLENENISHEEQKRRVNSLKRRILLPTEGSVQKERSRWLSSMSDKNASKNISTARNLNDVLDAADRWIEEYKQVSSVVYAGEDAVPFSCDNNTSSAKEKYDKFCVLKEPEKRSIIAMFFCMGLILLTYFFLWRPRSRYFNRR